MTSEVPWRTALVIDNDETQREALAVEIRRSGYDVITANATSAEHFARTSRPTAIVLVGEMSLVRELATRLRILVPDTFMIAFTSGDHGESKPAEIIDAHAIDVERVIALLARRLAP